MHAINTIDPWCKTSFAFAKNEHPNYLVFKSRVRGSRGTKWFALIFLWPFWQYMFFLIIQYEQRLKIKNRNLFNWGDVRTKRASAGSGLVICGRSLPLAAPTPSLLLALAFFCPLARQALRLYKVGTCLLALGYCLLHWIKWVCMMFDILALNSSIADQEWFGLFQSWLSKATHFIWGTLQQKCSHQVNNWTSMEEEVMVKPWWFFVRNVLRSKKEPQAVLRQEGGRRDYTPRWQEGGRSRGWEGGGRSALDHAPDVSDATQPTCGWLRPKENLRSLEVKWKHV